MSDYAKYTEIGDSSQYEGVYNRKYIYGLVFNITLGGFYFGYVMSAFNPVKDFVQLVAFHDENNNIVKLENSLIALMTSFVALGAAAGALIAGNVAAKIGRKYAALVFDILSIIGTVLTIITNPYLLLVGRLLQGFTVGANSSLVPLMVNEVAPMEAAGTFGTFNQLQICFGVLAAPIIALGMPFDKDLTKFDGNNYYKVVLGFAALAPVLRILLSLTVFRYDTPKFLVSKGEDMEASNILSAIYGDTRAQTELVKLKRQQDIEAQGTKMTFADVFGPKYRKRLFIGIGVAMFQQFSGINAIIFFSNDIFKAAGAEEGSSLATIFTIVTDVLQIVGCLIAGAVIERLGRRILLIGGFIGLAVLLGAFGLVGIFNETHPILKFFIWGYILGFGLTLGPVPWIYIADILPDVAIGCAVLFNWLTVFGIGMGFKALVDATSMSAGMGLFAVLSLIGAGFMAVFAKETKGKNPQEIDQLFQGK